MATIVPKLDRIFIPPNLLNATGINPTNEYTLSVVVFDRRTLDRDLTDENSVSERVVNVRSFYSNVPDLQGVVRAFSGGDIVLESRGTRGDSGRDDLEMRGGDWLMFSGQKAVVDIASGVIAGPTVAHKWYRVVNAGEEPVYDGTTWTRDITVVGPDWDTANIPATQVTIVRGVVQVMERTIRLESSSMWTQ